MKFNEYSEKNFKVRRIFLMKYENNVDQNLNFSFSE